MQPFAVSRHGPRGFGSALASFAGAVMVASLVLTACSAPPQPAPGGKEAPRSSPDAVEGAATTSAAAPDGVSAVTIGFNVRGWV